MGYEMNIKLPIAKYLKKGCLISLMFFVTYINSLNAKTQERTLDFSSAEIVVNEKLADKEEVALEILQEEIESRTKIHLPISSEWPDSSVPTIIVGIKSTFENSPNFPGQVIKNSVSNAPEGFTIRLVQSSKQGKAPSVYILGNDSRGVIYGVGYFLRKILMEPVTGNRSGKLLVPENINIDTHPEISLRGHQLGYRPKTNSYDGFSIEMWEQYIRDLVVFGTNAIELIPPNTDDADESPMFPRPQMDMMVKMNELLVKYGLDTWIWYPLMYGDYSKSGNVEKSLEENEEVFKKLSKIDALFIPGGDPGHQRPEVLFQYLEKKADLLHKYHPDAEIWVSPQGFNNEWMEEFFSLVKDQPKWLSGIVYGPQVRQDVDQLREIIPNSYPIRRYPDITHNLDSQYPVPNWDFAFAATQHRESINPRPTQQKDIFNKYEPSKYKGFITYSEGINDDVNKAIWGGLGWDRQASVIEILRDYSRYFIGLDYEDDFAQALLDLENNWDGALISNSSVFVTHEKFQSMERQAPPNVRANWRFQMALFRSYYDAYNRGRLLYETQIEEKAIATLSTAGDIGTLTAMEQAENILNKAKTDFVVEDWRQRIFELSEALFQSIRMQKSVDKYFAIAVRRGANLDLIDYPLNNRIWLIEQFERIRKIENEDERLKEINDITSWTNPGTGGFYDDLGSLGNQPHVVKGKSYNNDPAFLSTPFVGFTIYERTKNWRISWARYMQTLYDQPLEMHYSNLDTDAQYEIKVTYTGNSFEPRIRLMAGSDIEVHGYLKKPLPIKPVTFDIPREATKNGELTLQWNTEPGIGGTGRGCQVAEVWIMKKEER